MKTISFTVNSIPIAQPRQRHAIRGDVGKQFIANYTPKKHPVNAFKSDCRIAASFSYGGSPLNCPLRLIIIAVFPRPGNKIYKKREMPRAPKASKPDFDNLAKSVCDALNGIIWRDDSLVTDGRVIKRIARGDEQPHVEIEISEDLGECS